MALGAGGAGHRSVVILPLRGSWGFSEVLGGGRPVSFRAVQPGVHAAFCIASGQTGANWGRGQRGVEATARDIPNFEQTLSEVLLWGMPLGTVPVSSV